MSARRAAGGVADRVARERLDLELRSGQREAIDACRGGRDVIAVMPTGYGKSAIYQVAAVIRPGPTIVVSPLIALQADQAGALADADAGEAAVVNSTVSPSRRAEILDDLAAGRIEYVLLAPEQFRVGETVDALRAATPSLFVVDEAHCISAWGHDFRPDYLQLGIAAEALGRPPIMALTATASPLVRDEIADRLGMRDPHIVVRGFMRENLRLSVERFVDGAERDEALVRRVHDGTPPGIVYVATRRAADDLAADLQRDGLRVAAYHGGMRTSQRHETHAAFVDGELDVVVATSAFGLGIDKPDVRFVHHRGMPDSVDAYYQEVGRAGRDGDPAEGVLFHVPGDVGRRRFLAGAMRPDAEMLGEVLAALPPRRSIGIEDLAGAADRPPGAVAAVLPLLDDVGAVEMLVGASVRRGSTNADDAVRDALDLADERRAVRSSRIEMMRAYAESDLCRWTAILSYLGEPASPPCGRCDVCDAGMAPAEAGGPFAAGDAVTHASWGEGRVMRADAERVVVQFASVGYRTLATSLVVEDGILQAADGDEPPPRR